MYVRIVARTAYQSNPLLEVTLRYVENCRDLATADELLLPERILGLPKMDVQP